MKRLRQFWEICREDNAIGSWACLITTIFLFVGAAITPPMFVIDGSILASSGILFAFATLWKAPNLIKSVQDGKKLILQHGNTSLSVTSDKQEKEEEDKENEEEA